MTGPYITPYRAPFPGQVPVAVRAVGIQGLGDTTVTTTPGALALWVGGAFVLGGLIGAGLTAYGGWRAFG